MSCTHDPETASHGCDCRLMRRWKLKARRAGVVLAAANVLAFFVGQYLGHGLGWKYGTLLGISAACLIVALLALFDQLVPEAGGLTSKGGAR